MRDVEKTVGSMFDKQRVVFVGSTDKDGFSNIKAMYKARIREGVKTFYLSTNTSSMCVSQFRKDTVDAFTFRRRVSTVIFQ